MLSKATFILIKHKVKQYYCEILLQFTITIFFFNIFSNVIYSCSGKVEFPATISSIFSVT